MPIQDVEVEITSLPGITLFIVGVQTGPPAIRINSRYTAITFFFISLTFRGVNFVAAVLNSEKLLLPAQAAMCRS